MSKTKKRLLIILGVLVFIAAAGYLVLTTGLNSAVASGIKSVGSDATQTPVDVDDVEISIFSGKGEIRGLVIKNPDAFNTGYAFELGRIAIHIDIASVRKDVIVIHEISIDGARLIAQQKLPNLRRNNLRLILNSLRDFADTEEETAWPSNLVIEQLHFTNAQVTLRAPLVSEKTFDIPDVHVSDIGRASVGVSIPEAPLRILEPLITEVLKVVSRRALGG